MRPYGQGAGKETISLWPKISRCHGRTGLIGFEATGKHLEPAEASAVHLTDLTGNPVASAS
jgi:hypothetical protein